MKFTISSNDLKNALSNVVGAISNNPILPVLEDFLFMVSDNKLTITATDLEIYTSVSLPIETVQKEGTVAIPAKLLTETVKMLPNQPITIEADENNSITITSAFGEYELAGEPDADFPKVPTIVDCESFSIEATTLLDVINKTLFATSNDELRPAMTGVLFDLNQSGTSNIVATDAHKLVKYPLDLSVETNAKVIIPKRALQILKNVLSVDNVGVSFNETNVFFTVGSTLLVSRLIDARYPDYNSVFPTTDKELIGNRSDILRSVKRLHNYTNKTTNRLVLELEAGNLTMNAHDTDFNNKAKETIPVFYEGEDMKIGFNAKFLIDSLNALNSEDVKISLLAANRPAVITESEGGEESILIMPVMLG